MMIFISIVLCIVIIWAVVSIRNLVQSFEELLIKFIDKNQEFYKNQKAINDKTSSNIMELKKVSGVHSELKRTSTNIQETLRHMEHLVSGSKLSEDSSKINSSIGKLESSVNKLDSTINKLKTIK